MTDSINRLVDFLTVPQEGKLQSGMLDVNKVKRHQPFFVAHQCIYIGAKLCHGVQTACCLGCMSHSMQHAARVN